MAANVALSDTFDTWRVRTNQLLAYTQTDGGSDALHISSTTDSTSKVTGALIVDGGVGVAKKVYLGNTISIAGDATLSSNLQVDGSVTIGTDTTDSVNFVADINSALIPNGDSSHQIGNSTARWTSVSVTGYVGSNSSASVLLPKGTTSEAEGAEGSLRYNTTLDRLEVNAGSGFIGASGSKLSDADIDTYIEIEESSDEDKVHIYTAGTERLNISAGGNVAIGQAGTVGDATLKVSGTMNVTGVSTFNQEVTFDANTTFSSNVTVQGDLVVTGTTTTVDSTTVTMNDKTLVLGTTGTAQLDKSFAHASPPAGHTGHVRITNSGHGLANGEFIFLTEIASGSFSNSTSTIPAETIQTVTTINSSVFTVDGTVTGGTDGTISYTGAQSDTVVDGGGLILPGNTVHKITWDNSNDLWNFTDGASIAGTFKASAGGTAAADTILKCTNTDGTSTWVAFGVYNTSGTRLGP